MIHIKRIIALLLCICILAGGMQIIVMADYDRTTVAAKQYSTSPRGLFLIENFEGYYQYKYWDYTQWSIGYGTRCGENDYPNGITRDEAEALLKSVLVYYEAYVDRYLYKSGVTVTQNQYDALVSFTYNLGDVWTQYANDKTDLMLILENGVNNYTAQQVINAFCVFVHAGNEVLPGLVRRRTQEAELFLSTDGFMDVPEGAWFYNAVNYVSNKGLLVGVNGWEFMPNTSMTRAMTVCMLGSLSNIDKSKFGYPLFADVTMEAWYATSVTWASMSGIASGTAYGIFSPNTALTRQDFCVMLRGYAKMKGLDTTYNMGIENGYGDFWNVSGYAQDPVKWALSYGFMNGDENGYINPKKAATRAEVAQMMTKFCSVFGV